MNILFYLTIVDWLTILEKVATIITAASLVVALIEYFYKKKQDKTLAVADQVSFFREKVLPKGDEFINLIREKDGNYVFNYVKLDLPTLKDVRENQFDASKQQADLVKMHNTLSLQTNILNILEELSLRIIHSKTFKHKALNSIKPVFVNLVELNAVVMLMQREIFAGNKIYSATLDLYNKWKDDVDRSSPDKRLEELVKSFNKK